MILRLAIGAAGGRPEEQRYSGPPQPCGVGGVAPRGVRTAAKVRGRLYKASHKEQTAISSLPGAAVWIEAEALAYAMFGYDQRATAF